MTGCVPFICPVGGGRLGPDRGHLETPRRTRPTTLGCLGDSSEGGCGVQDTQSKGRGDQQRGFPKGHGKPTPQPEAPTFPGPSRPDSPRMGQREARPGASHPQSPSALHFRWGAEGLLGRAGWKQASGCCGRSGAQGPRCSCPSPRLAGRGASGRTSLGPMPFSGPSEPGAEVGGTAGLAAARLWEGPEVWEPHPLLRVGVRAPCGPGRPRSPV